MEHHRWNKSGARHGEVGKGFRSIIQDGRRFTLLWVDFSTKLPATQKHCKEYFPLINGNTVVHLNLPFRTKVKEEWGTRKIRFTIENFSGDLINNKQ